MNRNVYADHMVWIVRTRTCIEACWTGRVVKWSVIQVIKIEENKLKWNIFWHTNTFFFNERIAYGRLSSCTHTHTRSPTNARELSMCTDLEHSANAYRVASELLPSPLTTFFFIVISNSGLNFFFRSFVRVLRWNERTPRVRRNENQRGTKKKNINAYN